MKWFLIILMAFFLSACGGGTSMPPQFVTPQPAYSENKTQGEVVFFGSGWTRLHDKEYGVTCWGYKDKMVCLTDAQLQREK